jgi:hypothetical protein
VYPRSSFDPQGPRQLEAPGSEAAMATSSHSNAPFLKQKAPAIPRIPGDISYNSFLHEEDPNLPVVQECWGVGHEDTKSCHAWAPFSQPGSTFEQNASDVYQQSSYPKLSNAPKVALHQLQQGTHSLDPNTLCSLLNVYCRSSSPVSSPQVTPIQTTVSTQNIMYRPCFTIRICYDNACGNLSDALRCTSRPNWCGAASTGTSCDLKQHVPWLLLPFCAS